MDSVCAQKPTVFAWDLHDTVIRAGIKQYAQAAKMACALLYNSPFKKDLLFFFKDLLIMNMKNQIEVNDQALESLFEKYPLIRSHEDELRPLLNCHVPIDGMLEIIRDLHAAGHINVIASNIGEKSMHYIQKQYPEIFEHFAAGYSAQTTDHQGIRYSKDHKPHINYFIGLRKFLIDQNIDLPVVFIDDKQKNIDSAHQADVAMQAIRFKSPQHLRAELEKQGYLPQRNSLIKTNY